MTESPDTTTVTGEFVGSRDVRTGFLSGPGFADVPVRYDVVDGVAIFDGCIDMGPVEEVEARAADVRSSQSDADAGAAGDGGPVIAMGVGLPSTSEFLWTDGIVPFVIDGNLPNANRVTQAIAHIEENTGIRFVQRGQQANFVRFVRNPNANWSSSAIGMRGGEQLIRISDAASMGTVVHECLHCLGVLHEQSRCDRDRFVTINYENVQDGFESNFDRFCAGYQDYFDYDYGSIMHYPATAFSDNGQPTIVPLRSGVTIGQRTGMSITDRLTIAEMYSRFTGRGHTGVWRAGTGRYGLWVNATWDSFRAKWEEWAQQGLRLIDIDVRRVGGTNRYSGVWREGSGGYGLWVNASWPSFRAKWEELSGQGLRLVDLDILRVDGEDRYSGVFMAGSGGYGLWVNSGWDGFRAKWEEWAQQGLRLVDINVQEVDGQNRYSGVWLAGTGGYGLWVNAGFDGFRAKWEEWARQGLRLADINVHRTSAGLRYSGAFLPGTDGHFLWANVPWQSLRARWQQLAGQGLRLIDYEFTEGATADADALDGAGTPLLEALASDAPEGAGGLYDDSGPLDEAPGSEAVAVTPAADADGDGAVVLGAVTAGAAADADGAGGAVLEPGRTAAPADGDGQGGAVLGVPQPAAEGTGDFSFQTGEATGARQPA